MKRFFRGLAYVLGGLVVVFVGLPVLAYLIYFSPLGPWDSVDVPLPEILGTITFSRIGTHPFFAEYDRHVNIRLSDGRRFRSDLMTNYGGQTKMFFHWQPARGGLGPFLMLEDRIGATWINLNHLCLKSSRKPNMVGRFLHLCPEERVPISVEWNYLGRVEAGPQELEFIPGTHWPPKGVEVGWHLGPPIPLPGKQWSFEAIKRPPARWGTIGDEWLILRENGKPALTVPIESDKPAGDKASLRWYPTFGSRGPYLRVGKNAGTLVDLRRRRIFTIHSAKTYGGFSDTPNYGTAMGVLPFPRADGTHVIYLEKVDRLILKDGNGVRRPLPPAPDFLSRIQPVELGMLHWRFSNLKYIPAKQP